MSTSKTYEFLDGPPFINGKMHHGHALVSSIKDTILLDMMIVKICKGIK